jgi:hypothetical protein
MDKTIVVKINMFTFTQSVYLPSGEIKKTTLNQLSDFVRDACYENEVYNVELRGPAVYIPKVARDIQEAEMTKYGESKIKIKRNKEY